MATPKEVLSQYNVTPMKKENPNGSAIAELISRAFTTRNLTHFAHWSTNSYAAHQALGELYDEIVGQIDEIVEVYQGKYGLLKGLTTMKAKVPSNILKHVEAEAEWIAQNKEAIAGGCDSVMNLIDELDAAYLKIIYKLTHLK